MKTRRRLDFKSFIEEDIVTSYSHHYSGVWWYGAHLEYFLTLSRIVKLKGSLYDILGIRAYLVWRRRDKQD